MGAELSRPLESRIIRCEEDGGTSQPEGTGIACGLARSRVVDFQPGLEFKDAAGELQFPGFQSFQPQEDGILAGLKLG